MQELQDRLEAHLREDDNRFSCIEVQNRDVLLKLERIEENHLKHMEPDLAAVKTDISWIRWIIGMVAVPSVGGFIVAVYQLITRR